MMATTKKRKTPGKRSAKNPIFQDLADTKLARALWAQNKRVESARLFRTILKKHPANVPALIDASRVMRSLFDYRRATEYLDTVNRVGARSARANFLAGQTYRLMKQPSKAIESFNKSLELNSCNLDAHLELAILHERMGDLEQAKHHVEQRLCREPGDHESLFLVSKLNRRLDKNAESKNQLESLAHDRSVFWMTKARCWFELAKIHDGEQAYDAAWDAARQGNELLSVNTNTSDGRRDNYLSGLLRLASDFEPGHLRRWLHRVDTNQPHQHVLLTGLPRSGTTLLANLLGSSEHILAADEYSVFGQLSYPLLLGRTSPEDLNLKFFDRAIPDHIRTVRKSYRSSFQTIFPDWSAANWLLDKNPSLLPLVIPYLASFPEGKLIIAMRDPRDTFVSCYMTYMPANDFSVDKAQLDKAIRRFEAELTYWHSIRDAIPEQQQLEVRYESLVANAEFEMRRCREFLGLGTPLDVSDYPHRVDRGTVHSPSYEEATQPIYLRAIGRWKNYEAFLAPVLDRLNCLARTMGY